MKHTLFFTFFLLLAACTGSPDSVAQTHDTIPAAAQEDTLSAVELHFRKYADISGESRSLGTVSNGSLENGYIFPFSGKNYHYFDTNSYLHDRCFVNGKVRQTVLSGYRQLETKAPGRIYGIMECSNEHGGRIYPHRTHQNGMSVDLMSPLLKDGNPYTGLDYAGAAHYLMNFDASGRYEEDTAVTIDFDAVAQHLLILDQEARKQGLRIEKVIWKMELRDELFASAYGKQLQAAGIYVTTKLSPLINALHDDHYHVDFKPL